MKSQFVRIVLTAGLTILGSISLSAQSNRETAKIPFAFHVGETQLSAGDYTVQRVNTAGLFQVTRQDGHSMFINAPAVLSGKAHEHGRLTFACYAKDCALSQIWMDNSELGYSRSASSLDRDLSRRLSMAALISIPFVTH